METVAGPFQALTIEVSTSVFMLEPEVLVGGKKIFLTLDTYILLLGDEFCFYNFSVFTYSLAYGKHTLKSILGSSLGYKVNYVFFLRRDWYALWMWCPLARYR